VKNQKYLTTGEFARLCGTTKDTLFHYDRTGILKPQFISANGYRRYRAEQFFEYDLISVLKGAGSSLEEISNFLKNYDVEHFLPILDEKIEVLKEQQRGLARRIKNLEHISRVTRAGLTDDYDHLKIESRGEEKLLAQPLELAEGQEISWDETALYLSRHLNHCKELGLDNIFPVGSIIPRANLLKGIFTESHFFSTIDFNDLKIEDTLIKPAGDYACFMHKGSYDHLTTVWPDYLGMIEKGGLEICGEAYVYDLLSYLASWDEENDVHKIAVQVQGLDRDKNGVRIL